MTETRNGLTRQEVADLAAEALRQEGVAAYFPNCDPESFNPAEALAGYLWQYPHDWGGVIGCGWEFQAPLEPLIDFAAMFYGATLG